MGYSDQKYYDRPLVKVASAIAFGTATAAGTASNSLAAPTTVSLPQFLRRTKVVGLEAICITAAGGTQVGPINLTVLNGTSTVGTIAVQTATVGQVGTGVLTAANATFAANASPTMAMIGTYTASGATSGTWDLYLQQQEQPDLNS